MAIHTIPNPSLVPVGTGATGATFERHFAPEELGQTWGLSGDTIRRMFEKEPGVLVIERTKGARERRYRTMRIPESVALRVHRRLTNPSALMGKSY